VKNFIIVLLVLFVSGCSSPYVVPKKTAKTAKINFKLMTIDTSTSVYYYHIGNHHNIKENKGFFDRKELAVISPHKYKPKTVIIEAKDNFRVVSNFNQGNLMCKNIISFSPKSNREYVFISNMYKGYCSTGIYEINRRNGKVVSQKKVKLNENFTSMKKRVYRTVYY